MPERKRARPINTGGTYHQNNYEDLANAIVVRAAEDYVDACRKYEKAKEPEEKHNASIIKRQVVKFFRSRWFGELTTVNPEFLIDRLNVEAVEGKIDGRGRKNEKV